MQLQYKIDDTIQIDDTKYIVNASFDVILRLFDLLDDKGINPSLRIETALNMLIGNSLDNYKIEDKADILKTILSNYVKMEEKQIYDISGEPLPDFLIGKKEKTLDYNVDADLIYAAFIQVYGIDLIEQQGKLHWSKFQALMNGLPEGTTLSTIMGYRAYDETQESKDHKQFMREQKRKYSLGGDN